ncbi:alpha/beta hydrolase [Clostridium sp. D2Q-14]|uniref:alpha/beta fold hydrolase n=1 Tax=Anaeromonas gelatinilytica TaxID=2683194 RepID=UPI00193AE3E4|nr:alpha/beta fold hydrolase [Anaeromonas gelatinilytica]MBS4534514.1 alpha/beta hydrolase [Anaeromonas gelatinilytica]
MSRHKIVLIHGYFKTFRDMRTLKMNLKDLGYDPICVDLPLTFSEIDKGSLKFSKLMKKMIERLDNNEKISMVGHSTGGLIIRRFLLENSQYINYIDKCIFICTPNNGSELADMINNYFKILPRIFCTIRSLVSDSVSKIDSISKKNIKIGAIAGNKSNLITGRLLSDENDGRVTIASVEHEDLDDFIILPYNHAEIHYKKKTAKLIHNFIQKGKFK